MKKRNVEELKALSHQMRKTVLTMIYQAGSGHPGGSLSAADLMTALYFREMNVDPENPKWEDRDRFVLSKGHVAPIQYACLAARGFFPEEVLYTLRQEGSILQGHPDMKKCPGIDISTGSLGQGLACAVGMAIAGKRDHKDYRVYAMIGDGESQEGEIWEAAQTASKYQLDNLVVIVDNNKLQSDGVTEEVMPVGDLAKKFEIFGFDSREIDGHAMEEIVEALDAARIAQNGRPKCIVANTIKGKGVSFMENQIAWHGSAPNKEQYERAMKELEG